MSLRDKIAEIIQYDVTEQEFIGDFKAKNIADAILTLPEMQRMMKAEATILACLVSVTEDGVGEVNILNNVQEWKEKAEALDILEYGYPQEVEQALKKVREEKV